MINDEKKYKVSIITVCLNSVDTIEQTIQSVLNQTYHNIEYIIIDGKSKDGTQAIISKYLDQITYYCSEPDKGIYNAMNKGISHTTGDVIGILNSDDWYKENAVEQAVEAFQKYQCQVVHGDCAFVYRNGASIEAKPGVLPYLYMGMSIYHPTVFALKILYQKYGYFDENYKNASDYELMLRWYTNHVQYHYIPEVLTYFRKGGYSERYCIENTKEGHEISQKYILKYSGFEKQKYLDEFERVKKRDEIKSTISHKLNVFDEKSKKRLWELISEMRMVVIFGTGFWGIQCYEIMLALQIPVLFWVDNNKNKQGKKLLGLPIFAVEKVGECDQKILIGAKERAEEMISQLNSMGITNKDYIKIFDIEQMLYEF